MADDLATKLAHVIKGSLDTMKIPGWGISEAGPVVIVVSDEVVYVVEVHTVSRGS